MSTIGTERNLRIMTGTVGGQGGGVIATWLVRGLLNSGWQAQSTSLLGMSQRAGSVTAYIEARQGATSLPLVSSYPVPGDLDLVIGQELLEMARILQQGLPGRECAIISNTHRYLATIEKMPAEGGIYSSEAILNAVQQMAPNRHWLFNAQHIVAEAGLSPLSTNAVLLGAAMGALGLDAAPFRQSIEEAKIGVKDNLLAFDLGYSQVQDGTLPTAQFIDPRPQSPWQAMQEERTAKLQRYGGDVTAYGRLMERFTTELRGLDPAIGAEALYRLIDYQDGAYAELYLQRVKVRADAEAGSNPELPITEAYAKALSNWMTYEDGPRVAQLKTRADRFEKIRKDYGIKPDQKFEVTDFLVPDAPQIYGMLPKGLAQTVRKLGHRITPNFDKLKRETRMKTSAPFGYWSMRMVAWMRRLRPGSYRHQEEMDLIKRWEEAISHWSEKDPALGFLAAESARVTKGYGRVRETALDDFWSFLDDGLKELEQLGQRGGDMASIGDAALKILASEAGKGPETLEFLRNYNLEAAA